MSNKPLYRSPDGEKEVMAQYDAALKRWPVPHEEMLIPTRHGQTFIIASGNPLSPALILLHGISSNAVSWINDIRDFSRYFNVYAVDIPGDPGKSAPKRISLNNQAQAEWMDDLLNNLNISIVNILGISLGGWTALKYATIKPERINKLVVLTPAGIIPARFSFLFRAICLCILGPAGLRSINRLTFNSDSIQEDTAKFMDTIMTHFIVRLGRIHTFTDSELKRLNMPILLLGGKQDVVQNVEKIARRMSQFAPNLDIKIYPHKGHVLTNVTDDIISFLKSKKP
jgi:pimeloyl-ACP methyl ester carboxylesterase